MDTFAVEQHQDESSRIKLYLIGALNGQAAPVLFSQVKFLANKKARKLVLDLQKVPTINGEGIMLLTILCTQAAALGCKVHASGLTNKQHSIFNLAGLYKKVSLDVQKDTTPIVNEFWSAPISQAHCQRVPDNAINLNVDRRAVTSPVDGFGRMWLRSYQIALPGSSIHPAELMSIWKSRFSSLWPPGNAFYTPENGIQPGAVGLINLSMPLGLRLATGAVVIYEDETSFTLMTVQGHMFSGFINFSCYKDGESTIAKTQALIRPNDLLYEMSFWFGFGPRAEDSFWTQTLINLAEWVEAKYTNNSHPTTMAEVRLSATLIDQRIQWRHFSNIWYNAGVRSGIHQFFNYIRNLFIAKKSKGDQSL